MTGNETEAERSTNAERFNWHAEPVGVLRWALPTLLAEVSDELVGELGERTQGFQDVELRVFVNDVELPARLLLEGLVRQLDHEVDVLTARRLRQVTWLETLQLHVNALESALATRIRDAATELNLSLDLLEEDE